MNGKTIAKPNRQVYQPYGRVRKDDSHIRIGIEVSSETEGIRHDIRTRERRKAEEKSKLL